MADQRLDAQKAGPIHSLDSAWAFIVLEASRLCRLSPPGDRRSIFSMEVSSGALFQGNFEEKDGKAIKSGGKLIRDESLL